MLSMVMPALSAMVFALSFLLFSYMQRTNVSSEMHQAAVEGFVTSPWQLHPKKTIHGVKGATQVYEWLEKVFLNQLYMEAPGAGSHQDYCTSEYPCRLGEGNADRDAECTGTLQPGDRNCPTQFGSKANCCQPCVGPDCLPLEINMQGGQKSANTSVTDLSASCAEEMPAWLAQLSQWQSPSKPAGSAGADVTFCPERLSKAGGETRGLFVGLYNRALMGRISLKRRKLVDFTSVQLSNAYPQVMTYTKMDARSHSASEEDTSSFGQLNTYTYEKGKGFRGSGAFVQMLDLDKPKHEILKQISALKRDYWFDLSQGSLTVELLFYNGNVDLMLAASFTFEHDFSGQTKVSIEVSPLSFTVHDLQRPETYVRFVLYIIIMVLFVSSVKTEAEDMSADYRSYFSQPMGFLRVTCFGLCAYVIVLYLTIVFSYTFLNFSLPLSSDPAVRSTLFEELAGLAYTNDTCNVVVSVTSCVVFMLAVAETASLAPQWRLVIESIGVMGKHVASFAVVLAIMTAGFGQAGMFLCGLKLNQFSSLPRSFLTVIEMIKGKSNYFEIVAADTSWGDGYFLFLHFFFLIFQQFLGTIVLLGLFKERKRLADNEQAAETSPLRRFLRSVKAGFQRYSSYMRRCIVYLQSLVFSRVGGGGVMRVDYEQVARLRDKRATKPIIRTVLYEQRQEEEQQLDISTDVHLRAVEPFYPDGMMHYYVEWTETDGPARDFKVQKDFRLVGIKSQGLLDRERFRSVDHFKNKCNSDPQQLLKDYNLPVTLEFQGRVRPISVECIITMFFCAIFLSFMLQVSRVDDSFGLSAMHEVALTGPSWLQYNPTRIMHFKELDDFSLSKWFGLAVADREMGCVGRIGEQGCLEDSKSLVRKDWELFVINREGAPKPRLSDIPGIQDLDVILAPTRPTAADGMTVGFIPKRNVAGSTPMDLEPSLRTWNIGIMPHNHVRVTIQFGCFKPNEDPRYNGGYEYIMDPAVLFSPGCSDDTCMKRMIDEGRQDCYTFNGERRDPKYVIGKASHLRYEFQESGTFLNLGGIAVGLGNTPAEAEAVWNLVLQDIKDPVSMVFEFVNYNGNMDMFTYTTAKFFVKGTGAMEKSIDSVVFPLNVFNMGLTDFSEQKVTVNWVLFSLYILATVFFMAFLLRDILIQLSLTSLTRPWYMFVLDFFEADVWNTLDVVCVVLNVLVIDSIFRYILINGSLDLKEGFKSWTLDYSFQDYVGTDDKDSTNEFGLAASMYSRFIALAALNGMLVMIRNAKYFRSLTALRLILTTLALALWELVLISMIITVILVALIFTMHIRFGILFERYGTISRTGMAMFMFLVGSFDTEDLHDAFPVFFLSVFAVFQAAFLIILNLFVAAVVYRWKDTRRDAEEFSIASSLSNIKDSLRFLRSTKSSGRAEEDKHLMKLDKDFWQQLSVLRHVANLDESGKIVLTKDGMQYDIAKRPRHDSEDTAKDGAEEEDADEEEKTEQKGPLNFANAEDRKRFIKVFKKAHMEIASQMSRTVVAEHEGHYGAGDDHQDGDIDAAIVKRLEDEEEDLDMIGIIEEPQLTDTVDEISKKLNDELEASERPAEEIWLDALVTVLEEAGALEKLQKLFLPMPMILPKKTQEWGFFYQRKMKMERRLNRFLQLLKEEAQLKHYVYLKDMAASKERVLKQQSLVLTDYLQTLDSQIEKLQEEIRVLERKKASMRAHVSPIL